MKHTSSLQRSLILLFCIAAVTGCATTGNGSASEKRLIADQMHEEVLNELYLLKPDVRSQIASASGYGVFNNVNVNLLIASFGGGYGVVKDNRGGGTTYMNMAEVGVGLGAGVKDFRAVFVFHNGNTLKSFVENGWTFGAQADAAAKASDKGAAVAGEAVVNGISIYQLTKSGLALQATVKGTKFWRDSEMNTY
ncbi:MAG: lipid-binding SYLF domain-containing protein [Arenicella sp.]|jgi:lipid-binding SYLF domain-containing protein